MKIFDGLVELVRQIQQICLKIELTNLSPIDNNALKEQLYFSIYIYIYIYTFIYMSYVMSYISYIHIYVYIYVYILYIYI